MGYIPALYLEILSKISPSCWKFYCNCCYFLCGIIFLFTFNCICSCFLFHLGNIAYSKPVLQTIKTSSEDLTSSSEALVDGDVSVCMSQVVLNFYDKLTWTIKLRKLYVVQMITVSPLVNSEGKTFIFIELTLYIWQMRICIYQI